MKKLLSIVLVFSFLLSFVACVSEEQDSATETTNTTLDNANDNISSNDDKAPGGDKTPDGGDKTPDGGNETPDGGDETPESPNEKVDFVACLNTLLKGYHWNPSSIIPETLRSEYAENLINKDSVDLNYSNFVSVSDIPKNGIGEQWNMTVENISEAQKFFLVLSVIDNLATVSVTAFNNYIDENPTETVHYVFQDGIYTVTIHCTQETIYYVLDYTVSIFDLGEQSIQIALSMDIDTEEKNVRIQIGDANAVAYTVNQNRYTFAIKYFDLEDIDVGRRAFFEIVENSDGSITGHIYEYLTISTVELSSISDFYITEDYVTVVGNKASGMALFDGYICELYSVATGKMIAYEVKESLSGIVYNTLWFDLEDIGGITSIKHIPAASTKDKDTIYINGSSSAWNVKNYGLSGGLKAASRRFDIEFRTQYFYYYDAENDSYEKVELKVPMLFVQEEVYEDLVKDVEDKNDVTVSVNISTSNLTKLTDEYAEKIDLIEEEQQQYSVEEILKYIGTKKTFTV
ncbi:MAG: hypothetical protein IJD64_05115 [Clostridia bacterium]|nr:hypothetical protein [Clostridia bacterium]